MFTEIVYADDLNGFRVFPARVGNDAIRKCMDNCQVELHKWGAANQVEFDPGKESKHILSLSEPEGDEFKVLGVLFDCQLTMTSAVDEVVTSAGWKMRTLLRTRRFYTSAEMVSLYKANVLPYLEYRTPAIYHGLRDVLARLDRVQTRFLRDAGVSEIEALMNFALAPLQTRRDIAMLGLVHRTVLGHGPPRFKQFFKLSGIAGRRHRFQLSEMPTTRLSMRSALGLIAVYNMLPAWAAETFSVKEFQSKLQTLVKLRAEDGCEDWPATLSPRVAVARHALAAAVL